MNIMDGRGSRLQLACRHMELLNLDIGIFTEAKLNGKHAISAYGYDIISTKILHQNQGGIAIISKKSKEWHLEGGIKYGANVIKTTLIHEGKRTKIIGVYIPPLEDELSTC